jgi:hypothetical protein
MRQACGTRMAGAWLALGLTVLAPVYGDNNAVRQEIARIYEERIRASDGRDLAQIRARMRKFIEQHTTPNFVIRFGGRDTTRQQYLEQLKTMGQPSPAAMGVEINRLTVNGNTAIAMTAVRTVERSQAAPGVKPTGQLHTTITTATERDTWKKTSAGWKLKMMEPLDTQMTVDEKKVKLTPADGK